MRLSTSAVYPSGPTCGKFRLSTVHDPEMKLIENCCPAARSICVSCHPSTADTEKNVVVSAFWARAVPDPRNAIMTTMLATSAPALRTAPRLPRHLSNTLLTIWCSFWPTGRSVLHTERYDHSGLARIKY